jgi:predicted transcriptional regulator
LANNLEVCLSIIQFLDKKGPQTLGKIEISIITKTDKIKKCLDLLIEQKLIEKTTNHNSQETYANTDRGKRILEFFHIKF